LPEGLSRGHNGSLGTFEFFSTDRDLKILQPLSQYFASQLINLEWVQPGDGVHKLFLAASDIGDGASHVLVTSYAVQRPDGQWALLIINKDQENSHTVSISFDDAAKRETGFFSGPVSLTTFGKDQYQWHPDLNGGTADPDGPAVKSIIKGEPGAKFPLPAASVTVIRGTVAPVKTGSK
jgi:hypothetical protein